MIGVKVPCPNCGESKKKTAQLCSQCARAARRRGNVCAQCGGPVTTARARVCRRCYAEKTEAAHTCPICGGQKSWGSGRCRACDQAARHTNGADWHQIVQGFNPIAFRSELARADLDWSIRHLAEASGVSRSSIDNWIAGNTKPSRPEWNAVLKTLAFEPCRACNGLGHVDPTEKKLKAIEQRVTQPVKAPLPVLRISVASAVPVSVGRLVIDPATRSLTLDGASVELTRAETSIAAALASNADRLLTSAEIAQIACIPGAGAVRTHWGRLKPKLAQIGALAYVVTGQGSGMALSAQCERGDRRSA